MISYNRIISLGNGTSHYDIVTTDLIGICWCHHAFLVSNCSTCWTNARCQTDKIWIGSLLDDFHFIVVRNNGTPRPLAFKFDQTKGGKVGYTIGDHSVPSWRKVAAELEYYLSSGVRHYKEINAEEVNSIENVYAKRL